MKLMNNPSDALLQSRALCSRRTTATAHGTSVLELGWHRVRSASVCSLAAITPTVIATKSGSCLWLQKLIGGGGKECLCSAKDLAREAVVSSHDEADERPEALQAADLATCLPRRPKT